MTPTTLSLTGDAETLAAVLIFLATYAVLAVGKLPGLWLDRAGAALVGASLMVSAGGLDLAEAYRAIDLDTIALLLGMMIVVANLRLSGFFRLANARLLVWARQPLALLTGITLLSGVLSAFLVNDAVCLVLTPLVLDLLLRLKRNPEPYLLAVAMASNIGSTATITGNPQNMIIGSLSHIGYGRFAAALAPVAAFGLVLTLALIALAYRREFFSSPPLAGTATPARVHRPLLIKTLVLTAAMMLLFFLGQPPAKVAVVAGALLLVTRTVKSHKVYALIDWPLLLMFAGLFIVVDGVERRVLTPEIITAVGGLGLDRVAVLSTVTAVLSNLVSNVPAVLVLKPFVAQAADPERAWLTVAMASTLAGNFTILGSVANLIVVQRARAAGVTISFGSYFRIGAPLTVLTLLAGIYWLG